MIASQFKFQGKSILLFTMTFHEGMWKTFKVLQALGRQDLKKFIEILHKDNLSPLGCVCGENIWKVHKDFDTLKFRNFTVAPILQVLLFI